MANPWSDTVRLGVVQFMAEPALMAGAGPLGTSARRLLEDGVFEALEVGTVEDGAERLRVREAARVKGAPVGYCCQPMQLRGKLDLGAADETARLRAVDAVRDAIAQARDLGATGVAVMSGPDVPAGDRARALDATVNSLVMLAREALPLPLHLAVFDYDVEKRALLGPTIRAVEAIRRVRAAAPNAGLLLDLSHLPLQHEQPRASLRAARDVLTLAHVGNCVLKDRSHPRYGDQHPRFGQPGSETDVPQLADFLAGLFEIGYLRRGEPRIVTVEVKPGADETTDHLLTHTKRVWAEAWARVMAGASAA